MNNKIIISQSLICSAGILILSACTNLDPLRKESTESSKYDGPSFIVSNPDENLDERYQGCLVKAEKNTHILEGASKGVGGTVLVSGAAAIGTGLAGAVSAVPVAVALVVAGASTMKAGDVYKKYKGAEEVQECLQGAGYKVVSLETDDE
jgi:hypothetical protein